MTYIETWDGRMKASLLDLAILYICGNYQNPTNARNHDVSSIKQAIEESWEKVKMPTLYSTLSRMEEEGLLKAQHELTRGKVKKMIRITKKGFETKQSMQVKLEEALKVFLYHDELKVNKEEIT